MYACVSQRNKKGKIRYTILLLLSSEYDVNKALARQSTFFSLSWRRVSNNNKIVDIILGRLRSLKLRRNGPVFVQPVSQFPRLFHLRWPILLTDYRGLKDYQGCR
jgi:hypothetical protein